MRPAAIRVQGRVVAQRADLERCQELRPLLWLDGRAVDREAAFGAKARAADGDLRSRQHQLDGGHLVLGERPRLVGQDHRGGAQRLHGRKPVDQGVAARHAPHAAGQRQRGDDRQPFRDRSHCEGDARLDHEEEFLAAREAGKTRHDGDAERHADQAAPQPFEALLERRGRGLGAARQLRDPADFRCRSRCHHEGHRAAARCRGSAEDHAGALRQRRLRRHRLDVLWNRRRLPGQRGLVRLQLRRLQQAHVRGHDIAGFEGDDIARHQLDGIHFLQFSVAQDLGRGPAERPQRLHRPGRAQFRQESDQRVDGHDRDDSDGFLDLAKRQGDDAGREQQSHHEIAELRRQDRPEAAGAGLDEGVRAVQCETAARFRTRQPRLGVGLQLCRAIAARERPGVR